jgi:hypothetical protein
MRAAFVILLALGVLSGCSVWPVNQDPAGMEYRRQANEIIGAIQMYRTTKGNFPPNLATLAPGYLMAVPDIPDLKYHPNDGSISYHYIPSWPQLRPVTCRSLGNKTEWRCAEHLTDQPM